MFLRTGLKCTSSKSFPSPTKSLSAAGSFDKQAPSFGPARCRHRGSLSGAGKVTLPMYRIAPFRLDWVRIQKPVVSYFIVTCYKKAVCPYLFATLSNVSHHINFTIFIKQH
jgi:hypothetical protein